MKQVTIPSGPTVNYKYDGLGRRIQRTTTAGANERYVYDSRDALVDLNADWSVATTYLNGPGIDNHLRQTSATTGVSYFLNDHMGSTATLTDASGNPVEQESYDSFGNSAGSARTRYGYTGRERDSDTGMLYYRARFYDPQVGRFISEDPIGFRGGDVNLYAYVKNHPLGSIDPAGTEILSARQYEIPMLPPRPPPPPPFDYYGFLFADGGVLTRSTGEEFISARERARQPCKRFGERWVQNFADTNGAIPGLAAPMGTSIIPAPGAAQITGKPGLLGWAWRGGGPGFGSAAVQSGLVSVATNASFEGGIAVGSYIDAIGCPCGYEKDSGWLWRALCGPWCRSTFDSGTDSMNSEPNDAQASKKEGRVGLRVAICLFVLVGCWVLWFLLDRGWIIALGLSVVACLCGEYIGTRIFGGRAWFERLSVEQSGFSVWRIALGVLMVLLFFSFIVLARLVFLKVFH